MVLNDKLRSFSLFDPLIDERPDIAKGQGGNYVICLRKGYTLPSAGYELVFEQFNDFDVLYSGKSSSIYKRLHRQHFKDKGVSTVRKSVGVMHDFKQEQRSKRTGWKKTKFNDVKEEELTTWFRNNTVVYFYATSDYENLEIELINYFKPPINLQSNYSEKNREFRKELSRRRNDVPKN